MKGYIAVTEETLDRVAELTELPRSFWEREMKQAAMYSNTIVVFPHNGFRSQVSIHDSYDIPFVMKMKFGLEPEDG